MNLAAEFGVDQLVEHEHAAHDFADQGAAFIDRISARRAAMALDDGGGIECGDICTVNVALWPLSQASRVLGNVCALAKLPLCLSHCADGIS